MADAHEKIDSPECREDLVREAAASDCWYDFDWINTRQAILVTEDPRNRGLTASEIRELVRDWINEGKPIKCVRETREGYKEKRHWHY